MSFRCAIAGTGFSGALHAHAVRVAGGTVVGVAATTETSARAAAQRLGATRAFADTDELIAADDVDVVLICTPNHLHAPLAERALAAGKHVICEKPLATDARDAQRIAAVAEQAGVLAAVPFVYRYYPTVREARARVAAGAGGALRLIHGQYLQDWLLTGEDDNWRVDEQLGGPSRAFADIGSHWCDLAEFISGQRIVRLSARTLTAVPERRRAGDRRAFARGEGDGELYRVSTEDAALVQFETDGGALGSFLVSQISAGRKNSLRIELDGAAETYAFDQEAPESLWVGRRDRTELVRRDPASLSPAAARLAFLPAGHPQGYQDCFDLFVADAFAAIREQAAPDGMPRFADGARAAQITDAVLASAREQCWVDVPALKPAVPRTHTRDPDRDRPGRSSPA